MKYQLQLPQENSKVIAEYDTLEEALSAVDAREGEFLDIKLPNGDYFDWSKR